MEPTTVLGLIKLGRKARKAFRAWRQLKKGKQVLKGKLTYAGIGALVIGLVTQLLGIDIAPPEVDAVLTAGAAIVAVYGRWRATRA